jgi:hypothetical protein
MAVYGFAVANSVPAASPRHCSPQSFLFLLPKKWSGLAKPVYEPRMMLHLRQFNFMTYDSKFIDPKRRFRA